jgi:hypothetical protein
MGMFIRAAAAASVVGLLLSPVAASAASGRPAAPAAAGLRVQGGTATVTTTKGTPAGQGLASVLVENGIMPASTAPASQKLLDQVFLFRTPAPFSSRFRFSFPVAGGQIGDATARTGQVRLKGGLVFVNGKDEVVEIDHLVMDFTHRDVTGLVDAALHVQGEHPKRIAVFRLDLSHTSGSGSSNSTTIEGIRMRFAGAISAVLDHELSTKLFREGLPVGSASMVLATAGG